MLKNDFSVVKLSLHYTFCAEAWLKEFDCGFHACLGGGTVVQQKL